MVTYKNIHRYMCIWGLVYKDTFTCSQLGGPERNEIPVTTSTTRTQVLVFNTIYHKKKPGLLVEMTDSPVGTMVGNIQGESWAVASYSARKLRKCLKCYINGGISKGHRNQVKYLSNKIK